MSKSALKLKIDPGRRTVLVVDDEEDLLEILAEEIEEAGLNCLQANNVDEAIEYLRATPVDVVISDIRMPRKSGADLFGFIREENINPRPHFMFISGFSDLSASEAFDLGSDGFFHKPFQVSELLDAIQDRLEPRSWNWSKPFISAKKIPPQNLISKEIQNLEEAESQGEFKLGQGGAFIKWQNSFPQVGEIIKLNLKVKDPNGGPKTLEGYANVRWVRVKDQEGYPAGIGVEFVSLEEPTRVFLLNQIEKKQPRAVIPAG